MNETTLSSLKQDEKATVKALLGGCGFQHRLRSVGVKEGKLLHVVARHHFSGPMVVEVERRHITIGRGMAQKIVVARTP
ncbi:MAG: FeoA family protein [Kiritimatiellae bacterium]|nr:FeoA family protein [Kiritimatiellia bacterium]